MKERIYSYVLLASLFSTPLCASDIDDFLQTLEETTQLATKSRLNVDYVPGTMSIVKGEELLALGITDLSHPNALDSIVGMESISSSLRGSGAVFGSLGNKIKWMINGVSFESQLWGGGVWLGGQLLFPIPVNVIDRIEVIRGAGSALYGGNAIFGVINIVTKAEGSGVFGTLSHKGGNNLSKSMGTFGSYRVGDMRVDLKAYLSQDEGYDLSIGTQGRFKTELWKSAPIVGYAPGKFPNYSLGRNVMVDVKKGELYGWLYHSDTSSGQGLGWRPDQPLPEHNGKHLLYSSMTMAGLGIEKEMGKYTFSQKVGTTYSTNSVNNAFKYPLTTVSGEAVKSRDYGDLTLFSETSVKREYGGGHTVIAGVDLRSTKVVKDNLTQNYVTDYSANLPANPSVWVWTISPLSSPSSDSLYTKKPSRQNIAVYVQDEYTVNDKIVVTSGIRFDGYNDGNKAFSPRVAAVYRLNDSHILKSQLSRAFRPPSFIENFSSGPNKGNLKPETIDTLEFSHIYKSSKTTLNTTLFYSRINQMIGYDDMSYFYANIPKTTTIKGIEIEGAHTLSSALKIGGNVAYYKHDRAEYSIVGDDHVTVYSIPSGGFALAPSLLANMTFTLNPKTSYPTTLHYHYVGSKHRRNGDEYTTPVSGVTSLYGASNGEIKAQDYWNISQAFESQDGHWVTKVGVHNIFDKTLTTLFAPLSQPNYGDIPYARRAIFAHVSYKF